MQQCIVLLKRKGTTFTSTNVVGYYDEDYTFGADQGLKFALSLYDLAAEDGIDAYGRPMEEFAQISAYAISADGSFEELITHECTDEDFDAFYPLAESQATFEQEIRQGSNLCFNDS